MISKSNVRWDCHLTASRYQFKQNYLQVVRYEADCPVVGVVGPARVHGQVGLTSGSSVPVPGQVNQKPFNKC
jgi:hypothetical protein